MYKEIINLTFNLVFEKKNIRMKANIVHLAVLMILLLAFNSTVVYAAGSSKIKRQVSELYDKRKAMDSQRRLSSYGMEVTEYVLPLLQDKNNERVRISAFLLRKSCIVPSNSEISLPRH